MSELATTSSRAPKRPAVEVDENQYLTFSVAGERFAVGILDIQEIIELSLMTALPLAPEFIRGVFNLRGGVVPVVDLAVRLGKEPSELTKRSCIVVVEITGKRRQTIGMLVDEVNEILDILPDQMQPAPHLGDGRRAELLKGMGRIGEQFIVVLDIRHVLSIEDRVVLEQIVEQGLPG